MRKTPTRLTSMETYELINLLKRDYVEKKLSDAEFAVYAAEFLKNSRVLETHVYRLRTELGIPSSQNLIGDQKREKHKLTIVGRLEILEAKMTQLEVLLK